MWFPDDKMDVNKFQSVHIPPKSHYMAKFGFTSAPSSSYTGDEPAPMPKDKIGSIAEMDQYDAMMQREELNKQKEDLNKKKDEA